MDKSIDLNIWTHKLKEYSSTPLLDLRVMIAWIKQAPNIGMISRHTVLSDKQMCQFEKMVARRMTREPVAYIIGEWSFWSLTLKIEPGVLVPRPETEILVKAVLDCYPDQSSSLSVCDLGSGAGGIALALAKERPNWIIDGIDASAKAISLCEYNKRLNHLEDSGVNFMHIDWNDYHPLEQADIWVSNPPYININDGWLATDVSQYEPHEAVFADDDGLAYFKVIAEKARQHLRSGGMLFFEHGWRQASSVQKILEETGFIKIETKRDYDRHERVTYGVFQ